MENKGNNNNGNKNNGNNRNGMTIMLFILAALMVLFFTSLLNSCAKSVTNKEISYSEFINLVESDKVEKVKFTSNKIEITPKDDNKLYRVTYYTAELRDDELLPLLREHNVKFGGTVEDVYSTILWNLLSYILPLVLVWVLLYFLIFRKMGGGGVMGVGKTTAKVYVEKSTGVTFKDVAGQDEAKESLQEVVDFLHNPKKYTDIGAKLPKGALLVGPPGTGKTLLAKAVAGEAKVPFFSLAGSDFVEMFVGVGASRVRDLFKEAQKQAPCIIFIDEIDAIGKSRDTRYGGNDEREQTLNQLLAEMDGFDTSKGLLILAATNRPEVLDKALLRPGRFDRRIIVDKPDLKGRVETLKVHAKSVLMDETVDLDAIALATSGAVGSDLANMINEAAINAVKHGRRYVNQGDLFESVEVVIAGKEKKDRIMGPKEKKMVAYHEVGHALVTALQKDAEPVQKITIVPRTMGALGYTMQVPEEEKFLMTKNELVAHLVTYMGGRAAEEIVFDSVTTGASNDIEQATKIARAMVTQYGMSEKFGLMGLVTVENKYLDGRASLNCGEETAAQIDQEVMKILKESYDEAVCLLQENRSILDEISQYLYEHETITGKEFMKIFRRLKGLPEPEEKTEAQKAAEKFKVEETYVRSGYQQQTVKNEHKEEPVNNNYGQERESIHKEERLIPELKPLTPVQPQQIPAGITVLEETQSQEASVQLKSQQPPAGLTVLEEACSQEEIMKMPDLEEKADFRVPKFLQKQLDDVTIEDTSKTVEMDKDIVPSKEEKIIVGEAENIQEEEIQPVGGKLSEEFETTAETFPENDSKGKLPEELKDIEQETEQESDRTELFQEELEPEAIAEKLKPVTDTFSETMEEAGLLNEVTEAQTDHSVVSNQEQKKKSQFPKIKFVRTDSRKALHRKFRGESISKEDLPKIAQQNHQKDTIVEIETLRPEQENPIETGLSSTEPLQEELERDNLESITKTEPGKVTQESINVKIVSQAEPQEIIQKEPQEKSVPETDLQRAAQKKIQEKNNSKTESQRVTQEKAQEKSIPKAEPQKEPRKRSQEKNSSKTESQRVTQEKAQEKSIPKAEPQKEPRKRSQEKNNSKTGSQRVTQEKAQEKSIPKAEPQKRSQEKNNSKTESQRVTQEKAQEKSIPKAEPQKVIQKKSQEKSMPKAEHPKAIQEKTKKSTVVKKDSADKVSNAQEFSERQNNITKKVSRAADDFKELPKAIAVAEENVQEAKAQEEESNDNENYLDKLLKGLE